MPAEQLGADPDDCVVLIAGILAGCTLISDAEINDKAFGNDDAARPENEAEADVDTDSDADVDADVDADTDTDPDPAGEIWTDKANLNFEDTVLLATTLLPVIVGNEGTEPLLISAITTCNAVFTLGGTVNPPREIDPGESRTIEVSFTPTTPGDYAEQLTITSDDSNEGTLVIPLSGSGVACSPCTPDVEVDTGANPYAITDFFSFFGSADPRTVTISNIGDAILDITDLYLNNDFLATCGTFRITSPPGAITLPSGLSTSFEVSYTATGECLELSQKSLDENVLHIVSNDPTEPDYIIELSGAGI